MKALFTVIVTWLAMNFGLPANYNHPSVKFMSAADIHKARYGNSNSGSEFPGVIAVYDAKNRAILLPHDWTPVAPADVSILVHEMVHHLQSLGGLTSGCDEEQEALAYDAQERWLKLAGTDLYREFGMDRFTIKFLTACQIP